MRVLSRFLGLVFVVSIAICLASWPEAWAKATDEERLKRGEVLISYKEAPDSKVRDVQGEILYDLSPTLIWWVLTDYANWHKIFPDIAGSEVVERKGDSIRLKIRINNLWPYPDFIYTLLIIEDRQNWSITWRMEGEGSYRSLYGSATLKYFEKDLKKTHLVYVLNRDPGWLVPQLNAELDNQNLVGKRLMAIRTEARKRKKMLEGNGTDPNIKPKWWKAPFWLDPNVPPKDGDTAEPTKSDGKPDGELDKDKPEKDKPPETDKKP